MISQPIFHKIWKNGPLKEDNSFSASQILIWLPRISLDDQEDPKFQTFYLFLKNNKKFRLGNLIAKFLQFSILSCILQEANLLLLEHYIFQLNPYFPQGS